jgi:hypothetical protein
MRIVVWDKKRAAYRHFSETDQDPKTKRVRCRFQAPVQSSVVTWQERIETASETFFFDLTLDHDALLNGHPVTVWSTKFESKNDLSASIFSKPLKLLSTIYLHRAGIDLVNICVVNCPAAGVQHR